MTGDAPPPPAPEAPGPAAEGYCVKCRRSSAMVAAEEVRMSNGKRALRGRCRTCGTGMYKILGK